MPAPRPASPPPQVHGSEAEELPCCACSSSSAPVTRCCSLHQRNHPQQRGRHLIHFIFTDAIEEGQSHGTRCCCLCHRELLSSPCSVSRLQVNRRKVSPASDARLMQRTHHRISILLFKVRRQPHHINEPAGPFLSRQKQVAAQASSAPRVSVHIPSQPLRAAPGSPANASSAPRQAHTPSRKADSFIPHLRMLETTPRRRRVPDSANFSSAPPPRRFAVVTMPPLARGDLLVRIKTQTLPHPRMSQPAALPLPPPTPRTRLRSAVTHAGAPAPEASQSRPAAPNVCTATIARVRGVIARSTHCTERFETLQIDIYKHRPRSHIANRIRGPR